MGARATLIQGEKRWGGTPQAPTTAELTSSAGFPGRLEMAWIQAPRRDRLLP
jgi:hypothetical protein